MGNKVDLQHLKAAMVLAMSGTPDNPIATWWSGVARDLDGNDCIVLMVPNDENTNYGRLALKVLSGYGIPNVRSVPGSSYNLLPINVDYLENCLPGRVTREWSPNLDEGHNLWKKNVTDELDRRGIAALRMEYSGSGDSGNPDQFQCQRSGEAGWYPAEWNSDVGKHWQAQDRIVIPDELAELISSYVWETLVQEDCVNNDGGGGSLDIDLTSDEPVFLFSCYTNEHITHDHAVDEPV